MNKKKFGDRLNRIRRSKRIALRTLAKMSGVSISYLSRIENSLLPHSGVPTEAVITKLARVLETDPYELTILAGRIPEAMRTRILDRPDVFRRVAALDDAQINDLFPAQET